MQASPLRDPVAVLRASLAQACAGVGLSRESVLLESAAGLDSLGEEERQQLLER